MDFFEAQARAKKRTSRLVGMFVAAVIGTIVAMYVAVLLVLGASSSSHHSHRYRSYDGYNYVDYDSQAANADASLNLWNPGLFAGVTLATLAVVGLGSMYKWSQFSAGGSAVAESVGARRVDSNTTDLSERRLLNVVEEMAIAAGIPVPAVYIQDDEAGINAFAAGLTTRDAVVTVTRGTLDRLTRDELQGVIGHEFSHILNGDMRLNLRIGALIFGILVLGVVGRGVLWSLRGTRVRSNRNSGGSTAAILAIGVALVIVGYVGYFFGKLIQAAVSRQREFLADASSVQFTRNPAGITGALKKIGGFELGSTIHHAQSAAMGHFFFSQAFASGLTGLWDTHPPLVDRIKAIDPTFDGQFIEPAENATDSEADHGLRSPASDSDAARGLGSAPSGFGNELSASAQNHAPTAEPANPSDAAAALSATAAVRGVDAIGKLTADQINNAQLLLQTTPAALRTAAQTPFGARVLLYGLLLNDGEIRPRQRTMVERLAGADAARALDQLEPALRALEDAHRLPLVQLAMPALRQVPAAERQPFLATLDELIRADNQISAFEFALQRLLTHALALGGKPAGAAVQYTSIDQLTDEISVVFSVLAGASTSNATEAARAFLAGAAEMESIEAELSYSDTQAHDLAAFDAALDKLARASLAIKQRTLMAAAHVVQADGQVLVCEFELLRAISAALDIPMPPLAASVAAGS